MNGEKDNNGNSSIIAIGGVFCGGRKKRKMKEKQKSRFGNSSLNTFLRNSAKKLANIG
jgi:hypothetical protein